MWSRLLLAFVGVALAQDGPCTQMNAKLRQQEADAIAEGTIIADLPIYNCQEDGFYAAIQCGNGAGFCYCTAKDGTVIGDYSSEDMEGPMNCNCARDSNENKQAGGIGKAFACESNGNYKSIQCVGSVCFCVDEHGEDLAKDHVHISKQDTLSCQ